MAVSLQGCELLAQHVEAAIKTVCENQLDDLLNKVEEQYHATLAEQCEKLKQVLIDKGLDTSAVKEKECIDNATEKVDAEVQAEKENATQACVDKLSNFT